MTKPIQKNNPTKPPVSGKADVAPAKDAAPAAKADEKNPDEGAAADESEKAPEPGAAAAEGAKEPEVKKDPEPKAKKAKDQVLERAKEVFESHDVEEIYFTADCTAFIQEQHAIIHTDNLKDKVVRTVKRSEV